jgi:hypothetical protein
VAWQDRRDVVSWTEIALVAAACAGVTTLLLVAAGWVVLRRWVTTAVGRARAEVVAGARREVEAAADELIPRLRSELQTGLGERVEEVLPRLRTEVRGGVRDGAEEVLPRVRAAVRGGVEDALTPEAAGRVIGRASEDLARRGASVLSRSLDLFLGPEPDED